MPEQPPSASDTIDQQPGETDFNNKNDSHGRLESSSAANDPVDHEITHEGDQAIGQQQELLSLSLAASQTHQSPAQDVEEQFHVNTSPSNAVVSQEDEHIAKEELQVVPYDMPPFPIAYRLDENDPIHTVGFRIEGINPAVKHDAAVKEALDLAHDSWEFLSNERKMSILKDVFFCAEDDFVVPLTMAGEYEGVSTRLLRQHPLLGVSKSAREECLLGYYHNNCFRVEFDLSMGKQGRSILARAVDMLPTQWLTAILDPNPIRSPLFEAMPCPQRPRLCILLSNIGPNITLSSLVRWASLFYDGGLNISRFDDTRYKDVGVFPEDEELLNTQWELDYNADIDGYTATHITVLLRSLQKMAMQETLNDHDHDWNFRTHVFNWLTDYTTDLARLQGLSVPVRRMHSAKAWLSQMVDGRMARYGVNSA